MRWTKAQPPPEREARLLATWLEFEPAVERAKQGEGFEESLGVLFVGCYPRIYERLVQSRGFDPVTCDPVAR